MSGGAKKAAPREKSVQYGPTRYEVLAVSFINGALRHPGQPGQPGEFVYLPVGVKASKNLRAVGAGSDEDVAANEQSNVEAFLARHAPDVIADLADASDDGLAAALNAEKGGKGRVTVIEAIEREIEARKPAA